MSSAGLLPDRWAEFCRLVLRECSEEWARAKLSPELPRTLELFLEAAEFPTGDRQLDGFAEPFRTAVLDFFRAGEELGRQINGFKKTSELIEAFLKRLLLLTDPERLEKLHVPPPHWQSPHYKPSLGDLLGRRGLRSLSAPENIAKAAGRAIQIRNRVHESPEWTLREMSQGMVDCLLTVLWATAQYAERLENVLFAKPWEPYLHMLERRWKEHLGRWILLTADEVPMPEEELFDLTAEEVGWQGEEAESVDEIDRTEEEGPFRSEELEEAEREELVEREERFLRRLRTLRQGRVHELFDEVRRLVLVAEAGAGKTTSLQHYAALRAAESLARPYGCRWLPLFVELRHYSPQGLRRLLLESFGVEVDEGRFRRQLAQGRWFLLLDGLNEVPASLLEAAWGEIEGLTQHYPQAPVVLTSRSGLPVERFGLQIFRLHPLTDGQIEQFLQRHFSSREECTRFIAALRRNPRLWEWGRNPLQLWMLVQVGLRTKAELPANRGQLLDRFMTFLLTREERKGGQSPRDVKEDLLAELGFRTRSEGRITFRPDLGWGIVRQRCQEMGFNVDAGAFLRELCSNNLLVDLKENVAFAHEMYQEFFAAKGLQKRFAQSPDILDRLKGDRLWEEPIVLLYGLMNSHEGVFKRVLSGQPALAAECLASNIQPQVEQAELLAQEVRTLDYAAASEEKLVSVLRAIYVLGDGKLLAHYFRSREKAGRLKRLGKHVSQAYSYDASGFAATLGAFEHLGGEVPKFVTFLLQPFRGGNHQQGEAEKKQIEVLLKTLLRLGYQPNSVIRWAAAIGLLQGSFEQLASEGRIVEALLVAARDWQHSRPDVVPLVAHLLEEGQCQIAAVFSRSMGLLSQFGHVIVDRVVAAGKVTPALRFICDTGLPIEKPKIEALLQQLVDSGEVTEAADLAPPLGFAAKFGQEILDGLVAQGQSQEAFKFVEFARIGRKIGGEC